MKEFSTALLAQFYQSPAFLPFPAAKSVLTVQAGPHRLESTAALVIGATATVCVATGLGVSGVARELTLSLLGKQWGQAAPLVFWLGIGAIPVGMNYCIHSIMNVTNKFRLTTMTVWGRLVLLVPALIPA